MIFDYPAIRLERRHGPEGYTNYKSYRHWLRDEFTFRCFYCLIRETWGRWPGNFELDHFEPQSTNPDLRVDYTNLIYSCRRCNQRKSDQKINDPVPLLCSEKVTTLPDGTLQTLDRETNRLILQLDLNDPELSKWRRIIMRIVALAQTEQAQIDDPELYQELVGFPDNLPDLRKMKPPKNSRPEGIEESWFARRERGELPLTY